MNKFIKTDIENAVIQMKAAIMNALYDIDSGEETYIDLGENISANLLFHCLEEAKWKKDSEEIKVITGNFWSYWFSPSGKYVQVTGCLQNGLNFVIKIYDEDE